MVVCNSFVSDSMAPVVLSASTNTNSPATSGNTLQATPFNTRHGAQRSRRQTTETVAMPANAVGNPNAIPAADEASRTTAVNPIPNAVVFAEVESTGIATSATTSCFNAACCVHRNKTYVAPIASNEGKAYCGNHCTRDGTWSPYSTRLAGLEMGSTNDAALATNAQINR